VAEFSSSIFASKGFVDALAGPEAKKRADLPAGPLAMKIYAPTSYSSYNIAYPRGMNDGALYQGVGLDQPQRFGGASVLAWDWGTGEDRYYPNGSARDVLPNFYFEFGPSYRL